MGEQKTFYFNDVEDYEEIEWDEYDGHPAVLKAKEEDGFVCPHCKVPVASWSCKHQIYAYDGVNGEFAEIDPALKKKLEQIKIKEDPEDEELPLLEVFSMRELMDYIAEHFPEIDVFEDCIDSHPHSYACTFYGYCSDNDKKKLGD